VPPNEPSHLETDHTPAERRAIAVDAVRRLRDAGRTAFFAGGCVRDELLGRVPSDYDVATDARPGEIQRLFDRTSMVGAAFGVVLVHTPVGALEIATFREDGDYSDRRRPDRVTFSTPEHDAARRDFTINALFLDPLARDGQGEVIDFVGGREDLEREIVRAVGDPEARLAEDPLRALRAVRFTCGLGFELDLETANAIRAHARDLAGVSRERIGDEVRRMLTVSTRGRAIGLLVELDLDMPALGDAALGPARTVDRAARLVPRGDASGADVLVATLSAWALDRYGFEAARDGKRRADVVRSLRLGLCLSNDERAGLRATLETLDAIYPEWGTLSIAERKRLGSGDAYERTTWVLGTFDSEALAAVQADLDELGSDGIGLAPRAFIDGGDLIGLGLSPGPAFATILDRVYDAQLEGRVGDRDAGIVLARKLSQELGVQ
jgi:poly(A) polymerase